MLSSALRKLFGFEASLNQRQRLPRRVLPLLERLEERTLLSGGLQLNLVAPATAAPGSTITYGITLTNNGNTASSVTLSDNLQSSTYQSQTQTSGPAFELSPSGDGVEDSISSLGAGASATFSITAVLSPYLGDGMVVVDRATANGGGFSASASASTTVEQAVGTTTQLTSSVNPSYPGEAVTFTAAVYGNAPTGTVHFLDGNSLLASVTLGPYGQASYTTSGLALGNHAIQALYGGDSGNNASSSAVLTQSVAYEPTTTSLTSDINPTAPGAAPVFTAQVAGQFGDAPTGSVAFYEGSTLLTTATLSPTGPGLAAASIQYNFGQVGQYSIVASYGAQAQFTASSAGLTETVQPPWTQVSLTSSANPLLYGDPVSFTAQVNGAFGWHPTGGVTFYDNFPGGGYAAVGTAPLSADAGGASAVLVDPTLTLGTNTITAYYPGDGVFTPSATNQPYYQSVQAPTATALTSGLNPSPVTRPVTFAAQVTDPDGAAPTGSVTFMDAWQTLAVVTVGPGGYAYYTTNQLALGAHGITASYGGDSDTTASSAAMTQNVIPLTTTATLTSGADPSPVTRSVTFTAQVDGQFGEAPTGTVTFFDGTTSLQTVNLAPGGAGATATFTTSSLALGDHSLTVQYGGDATHSGGASAALDESIVPLTTTTALTSSVNPSATLQPVTFTAQVAGQFGETPTGTVTFLDGTTWLAAETLSSAGAAVFVTTGLAGGDHVITARYDGDATHSGSQASRTQTVHPAATTTLLSSELNPSLTGQETTFNAQVFGAYGGAPTGAVEFWDGATLLGQATLAPGGGGAAASFAATALALGDHTITAVYAGDGNYVGSTSSAIDQLVRTPTSISLNPSLEPSTYHQSVTFTAVVYPQAGGPPTGTVTFYDDGEETGSAAVTADGLNASATFTTTALAVGDHSITAAYSGDHTFGNVASTSLPFTVFAAPTTSTLTSSLNPSLVNNTVTFTDQISGPYGGNPTGTVLFEDGGSVIGSATLQSDAAGAQAVFYANLALGEHDMKAVYDGDDSFQSGASNVVDQWVQEATTTNLTSSLNPSTIGQSVTFSAIVSVAAYNASPTGGVTFLDGDNVLATEPLVPMGYMGSQATFTTSDLAYGLHDITAVYAGQDTFAASTSSLTQTVHLASTIVSVTSNLNPSAPDQAVTFTASAYGNGYGADGAPTGAMQFLDGTTVLATEDLTPGGNLYTASLATFTTSDLTLGAHSITVVYSGSDVFAGGASSALTQTVQQTQTYTTLSSNNNPSAPGAAVTFTVYVQNEAYGSDGTPTGTVQFLDGTTVLATEDLTPGEGEYSPCQATFTTSDLALGDHSITAVYSGDVVFAGSASYALTQTVQQTPTYTELSSSADTVASGQPITFTAYVSSYGDDFGSNAPLTGTVTFYDGPTSLGTENLSGGDDYDAQATLTTSDLTMGDHTIKAVYNGDVAFASSTSDALSQTITNSVSISPTPDQTNVVGDWVELAVNANAANGDPLTYSAANLPAGLSIDPDSGVISGVVAVGADNENPYSVSVTAADGMVYASQTFAWTVARFCDL